MTTINTGAVYIFTFKEGLLSKAAHDLRIRVGRFEIDSADGLAVEARFWPDSLRVDGAVKNGQLDERALSERDKREIEDTMRGKVLRATPIVFRGIATATDDGYQVEGTLTLAGRDASTRFSLRRRDARLVGEVDLQPTRWGIEPYRALMGALRVQDRVRVSFDLPQP